MCVKGARQDTADDRWATLARDGWRGLAEGAGNLRALCVDGLQNRVRKRHSAGLWQVEEVSSRARRHGGRGKAPPATFKIPIPNQSPIPGPPSTIASIHVHPRSRPHAPSAHAVAIGGQAHGARGTGHGAHQVTFPHTPETYLGGGAPSTLRVGTSRQRLDLLALP
jgi:hypothetical protein